MTDEDKDTFMDNLMAIGNYRGWLQYIADLAIDHNGCRSAKDLGDLVDELRACAIDALDEEVKPPIPADRKHGDKSLYPGVLTAVDLHEFNAFLTIEYSRDFLRPYELVLGEKCFVRGLDRK